jgi:multidrug efflux system outer membrane protein
MKPRALPLALCVALLAGCQVSAPWRRTPAVVPEVPTPAAWRTPTVEARSLADRDWREVFVGAELPALIDEALVHNSDLVIATARIDEARARYGLQRAQRLPTLALDGSYTRQRQPAGVAAANLDSELTALGLALPAWELDLWGRLADLNEAARERLLQTAHAREALRLSLIAEVASLYVELLAFDAELDVARSTAASRRESLRMVQLRFDGGVAAGVDLQQARTSLAAAERREASLARQRALTENALAVLVGRAPGAVTRETKLREFKLPPELAAGLPSGLLARRPDILAAEAALEATDADVEAARKAWFPTISLTGFLGLVSPQLSALFDDGRDAWSVTPAVTQPIFTAGRLDANLELARASQAVAAEQYRLTVRTAFREVDDALVSYHELREERLALDRAVSADRERLRLVELRYATGVSSYFEVLDSQRELFESELDRIRATAAAYLSVIQLYRALGGGWRGPGAAEELAAGAR